MIRCGRNQIISQTTLSQLPEQQRAWANAFLGYMGAQQTIGEQEQRKGLFKSKRPGRQFDELQGSLAQVEGEVTTGVQQARRQLSRDGEDIRRKRTVGKSTDKGFKENVVGQVDQFIAEVDELVAGGASFDRLNSATKLKAQLNRQLDHYQRASTEKDSEEKTEQRKKKAQAIRNRLDALDKFVSESGALRQERITKLLQMQPDERAKALDENPDIRNAVIASKPNPDELALMLTITPSGKDQEQEQEQEQGSGQENFVLSIVEVHGDDPDYMQQLCTDTARLEAANQQREAFFRGNSGISRLMKEYCLAQEGTQQLCKVVEQNARKWLKSAGRIEVDPNKIREREDGDQLIPQSVKKVSDFISSLLEDIYDMPVPPELQLTSKVVADTLRGKFDDATDDEVAIKVGGHIFLRILSPRLTDLSAQIGEQMGKLKGGEKNKDYQRLADQQRAVLLASKVLQNISNGTLPSGKEPYMEPFTEMIQTSMKRMQQYCTEASA